MSLVVSGLFCVVYLKASEQRYAIIQADNRTFLLDTETGATWRYFFNSVEAQGWDASPIHLGKDSENEYYRFSPCGEMITVPIAKSPDQDFPPKKTTSGRVRMN